MLDKYLSRNVDRMTGHELVAFSKEVGDAACFVLQLTNPISYDEIVDHLTKTSRLQKEQIVFGLSIANSLGIIDIQHIGARPYIFAAENVATDPLPML